MIIFSEKSLKIFKINRIEKHHFGIGLRAIRPVDKRIVQRSIKTVRVCIVRLIILKSGNIYWQQYK